MEYISAIICVKNEEKNLPRLITSLKDCSEIIIADGGSTDRTIELAKELGVRVVIRDDKFDFVSRQDIEDFVNKFGYLPSFNVGDKIPNSGAFRNAILKEAKNDWVFFPDADEIVSWDFKKIQELMGQYDQIECKLIQTRSADGSPLTWNYITKLFKKSKCRWVGRNHEVITPFAPSKTIKTDFMKIDHYPNVSNKYSVIPALEYAILKEGGARNFFYLGRDFWYSRLYDRAIQMFDLYIKAPGFLSELAEVYYFKALCLWHSERGNEARNACLHAIEINANMKKSFILMSEMIRLEMKDKWLKFAEEADNSDVIFP